MVLPCVPATAMPVFPRISSPSISARRMTGMRSRLASTTSGFVGPDGRGNDDDLRAFHVFGRMTDKDLGPKLLQPAGHVARSDVGAGNGMPLIQKNFRDAAHPDSADPNEMELSSFLVEHTGTDL